MCDTDLQEKNALVFLKYLVVNKVAPRASIFGIN